MRDTLVSKTRDRGANLAQSLDSDRRVYSGQSHKDVGLELIVLKLRLGRLGRGCALTVEQLDLMVNERDHFFIVEYEVTDSGEHFLLSHCSKSFLCECL